MPAAKVDALLEQLEAHQDSLAAIKAGDALTVVQSDGNLACAKPDGSVVGMLPANVAPQLRQASFVATVRSVKRQGDAVTQLQVRLTPGEPPSDPGPLQPAAADEDEENVARLTKDQLELLAQDEEVRWMLRDERLQKVIQGIDSAPDRERALVQALQAPNFKEFADKVLIRVAPEPV